MTRLAASGIFQKQINNRFLLLWDIVLLTRNMFYLSNPNLEGHMVYFTSANDCFAKLFVLLHESTRALMMLELFMLKKPGSSLKYAIIDCAGVPSTVFTMVNPAVAAAGLRSFQVKLVINFLLIVYTPWISVESYKESYLFYYFDVAMTSIMIYVKRHF